MNYDGPNPSREAFEQWHEQRAKEEQLAQQAKQMALEELGGPEGNVRASQPEIEARTKEILDELKARSAEGAAEVAADD